MLDLKMISQEAEDKGNMRTKKMYMSKGAVEPLFGNTISSLKPIAKKLLKQSNRQDIAMELYDTGNYDLMYLAGMIVDPLNMTKEDFNKWLDQAYFFMISDYIVAVSLSETSFAMELADEWIQSDKELVVSAGYATYCWLIGSQPDSIFLKDNMFNMLRTVQETIHTMPNRIKYSMYNYVYTLGISYLPLHKEAVETAKLIGKVTVLDKTNKEHIHNPSLDIEKAIEKGRIGFKRKYVRC